MAKLQILSIRFYLGSKGVVSRVWEGPLTRMVWDRWLERGLGSSKTRKGTKLDITWYWVLGIGLGP